MIHIQKFVDRVQGYEARGQKDFIMPLKDAKDLHADITRLLITIETLREQSATAPKDEVISVSMDGGSFK